MDIYLKKGILEIILDGFFARNYTCVELRSYLTQLESILNLVRECSRGPINSEETTIGRRGFA